MSKPSLLRNPRFLPLFLTQFAGALNDNLFKNGLVMTVTYGAMLFGQRVRPFGLDEAAFNSVASLLFILPFVLFSAQAGQVADKVHKNRLMQSVKAAEVGIMTAGAGAFLLASVGYPTVATGLLLVILLAMGTQSSVFGPAKYGCLPQLLTDEELVAGNALIELGTYLSILLGTLAAGVLIQLPYGLAVLGAGVWCIALLGYAASRYIVDIEPENPTLVVHRNPITPTWHIARLIVGHRTLFLSVLAISWFWGIGSAVLILLPTYSSQVLYGGPGITTLFLALFSIGIGAGSMLCERLSRHGVELGLVPVGSLGMTLFILDLSLVGQPWPAPASGELLGIMAFMGQLSAWRIAFDLLMVAISGGLFIVPLYTLIQLRAPAEQRSQVIAGNNIINSVVIVIVASLLAVASLQNLTEPVLFGVLAIANLVITGYIFTVLPEFMLRLLAWVVSNLVYRLRITGLEQVPRETGAVLVCNHVSFVDWLILGGAVKRPMRFVMHHSYFDLPVLRWLFTLAKVIPIASAKKNPQVLAAAMDQIANELSEGHLVCIFPEGRITDNGQMYPFKKGIEHIIARNPVPVIPMALTGLWKSHFSRYRDPNRPLTGGLWAPIGLTLGEPVAPDQVSANNLFERVQGLIDQAPAGAG